MKSKGILFLATLVIALTLIVSVSATTYYYHPTSGVDTTPSPHPLQHILTGSDLTKVETSNNVWYRNNGSWYLDYENTEYIQYEFSPGLEECNLVSTKLKIEWHTNSAVDEVRVLIPISGQGWTSVWLNRAVGEDRTDIIDLSQWINSLDKINDFKIRFQAKDDQGSENAWSYNDLIEFQVECDQTEPDTEITYFTRQNEFLEPKQCIENIAYVNYSWIVGHGTSTDAKRGNSPLINIQYVWDWGMPGQWAPKWGICEDGSCNDRDVTELWYTDSNDWRVDGRDGAPDGLHRLCGRAKDNADNLEVIEYPDDCCDVCVDTQNPGQPGKPVLENPSNCVANYINENPEFSWTASSDSPECSGIDYYDVEIYYSNGTLYMSYTEEETETEFTGENGRDYYMRVRAHDLAGNIGSWSEYSDEVYVDTENPEVEITAPEEGSWFNTDFQVSETDSDNLALWKCYFMAGSSGWMETICNENITVDISEYCPEDGSCTVGKKVVDNACNEGYDRTYYRIDRTAPETTKTVGDPKYNGTYYITSSTPFTLTCDDGIGIGCDETHYQYQYPNGTWTGWILYEGNFNIVGPDGVYTLQWYSNDLLNNVEETHNQLHYLDNTPPETVKTVGDPKYPYSQGDWYVTNHTTYTLTCSDMGSGCGQTQYRINGGSWITYTGPFTLSLVDGPFTLEWYSDDNLHNDELVNEELDYMDNTAPTIEVLEPNQMEHEFGCEASIFTVKARITDSGSGVKSAKADLLYENGTSTGRTCTMALQQGYYKCNINHWNLLGGPYLVKVTALDNVDNTGEEYVASTLTYDVYFTGGNTFTVLKGESGSTIFNVKLCHGGNATGMLMTKLCGVIDLSPTLTYGNSTFNIFQEDYFHFIQHLFEWQSDPFLPLGNSPNEIGIERTITLTVSVPDEFECNSRDIRCAYIGYKFGAAYEGMTEPAEPEPMLGALGWFDVTCNSDSITFGGGVLPFCGDGMKNQESEECDFSGTQTCEEAYGSAGTGYHWTGSASCNSCKLSGCTKVADESHHRGGGSGGSSSSQSPSCEESWRCGPWGLCVTDTQYRVCVDDNKCGTFNNKPKESQACENSVAEGSSNGNANANNGNVPLTGASIGASPFIGALLFVLIVALAVVVTVVARRLTVKSKK